VAAEAGSRSAGLPPRYAPPGDVGVAGGNVRTAAQTANEQARATVYSRAGADLGGD